MRLLRTLLVTGAMVSPALAAGSPEQLIARLKAVSDKGLGHKEAVAAAAELSKSGPDQLVALLKGMNDAGPLARNWLRGAYETAAERAMAKPSSFPKGALIAFFQDHSNAPQVRRLAFESVAKVDPDFAAKTIPESLTDPSSEMRRDAVAFHIDRAKALLSKDDKPGAQAAYELALTGAGDEDQLKLLSKELKDKFGREVDVIKQAGLVMDWYLLGPFDNKDKKGFDVAYPPESEFDLTKTYEAAFEGKTNTLKWQKLTGANPDGKYEIAKLLAPHKGAITYAAHEFQSDREQPVEFRFATPNAWKLWLNGELLFGREEYHRGMFYDMYQVRGRLKPGRNVILMKVCQNEQKEEWAQDWTIQFRVCDLTGRALRPAGATAALESPAR